MWPLPSAEMRAGSTSARLGEVIDGTNHVVGAQAHERAPHQIGAKTEKIKRPEQRRLHIVGAGRRWTRRDGQDDVALSGESIEFGSICSRDRAGPVNGVGNHKQNRGMTARRGGDRRGRLQDAVRPRLEKRWSPTSRPARSAVEFRCAGLGFRAGLIANQRRQVFQMRSWAGARARFAPRVFCSARRPWRSRESWSRPGR